MAGTDDEADEYPHEPEEIEVGERIEITRRNDGWSWLVRSPPGPKAPEGGMVSKPAMRFTTFDDAVADLKKVFLV